MARSNELVEPTSGLLLVSNPGSASRKYGVYDGSSCRATLHFETENDTVFVRLEQNGTSTKPSVSLESLGDAPKAISEIFSNAGIIKSHEHISAIAIRIVAPGKFFLTHRIINDETLQKLRELQHLAPLHITATLSEIEQLSRVFPETTLVGISDSEFHKTKPPYSWNYGINIQDADRLDIKRFGYHGISTAASIDSLWANGKLPPKVIVCHIGSGSSVTAVFHGRSIETTMGYTPLEGIVMGTRTGDISPGAAKALKDGLRLDDEQFESYLAHNSGLLGLGGTSDIRELIAREADGNHLAHLALTTLVHSIHKAIGAMMVTLNGADLLVFTGTAGERSSIIRRRIVSHLEFADFIIDGTTNDACTNPAKLTKISQDTASKPIIVIPTDESREIAKITRKLLSS